MSYITNQMAPTYEGGYDHSEPFDGNSTSNANNNNININNAAAYQYETYAMCSRCYTQQDCPHRHTTTTYPQQQGLNSAGYGMVMMTPAVVAAGYPRHDPPLSSVGVAFNHGYSNNSSNFYNVNNVNRSGQGCSQPQQPPVSSPWYGNGVNNNNKFASISNSMCTAEIHQHQQQQQQQQQQRRRPQPHPHPQLIPYLGPYTDFPGLGAMPMASPEEETFPHGIHGLPDFQSPSGEEMFPHGMHGLPDLLQRSSGGSGTVAPSALERYPAEQYTSHVQAENQSQSQTHATVTTTPSASSLVTISSTPSSSSSFCSLSSSSSSGEMILPRPTTRTPASPPSSSSSSSSSESRLANDTTYHWALYGRNTEKNNDPCSPRAVANRQIVPIIAAQHGHPVWPLNTKAKKNTYLLEAKRRGISYREIKEYGEISDAESTLRGRYRMLTKSAEERVRRPVWEERDLQLLHYAVQLYTDGRQRKRARRESTASTSGYSSEDAAALVTATEPRISWKGVAEYIARNGGSYKFGYATCKKKWEEFNFGGENI